MQYWKRLAKTISPQRRQRKFKREPRSAKHKKEGTCLGTLFLYISKHGLFHVNKLYYCI